MYGDRENDLQALLSVPKEVLHILIFIIIYSKQTIFPFQVADWHMLPICEGCDFFDICHGEAESENNLSQVAYLGKSTRNILRKFRHDFIGSLPPPSSSDNARVGTEIEDLHQLIKSMDITKIQKFEGENAIMNGSTLASLKMAAPRIEATRENKVVATGKYIFNYIFFIY